MKVKVEVVQFKSGDYGVRKNNGDDTYSYLEVPNPIISSLHHNEWWFLPQYIKKYCLFKNKDDACYAMKNCLAGTVDDIGTPVSCDCDNKWSAEPAVTCYKKPWYKFWSSI